MPLGAVIGGVAALGAGALGASAAKKSSNAQIQAQQQALEEQRRQFETSRADYAPYKEIGLNAINRLSDLYGLERASPYTAPNRQSYYRQVGEPGSTTAGKIYDAADPAHQHAMNTLPGLKSLFGKKKKDPEMYFDEAGYNAALSKYDQDMYAFNNRPMGMSLFEKDPGYDFRMNQGITAMDRSANARGIGMSGGTLQALNRYNQDYASNEYTNYVNRLSALAGIGQSSTNAAANLGATSMNSMSTIMQNQGNARANAYQSSYGAMNNALQGGLSNLATWQYAKPKTTTGGSNYNDLFAASQQYGWD